MANHLAILIESHLDPLIAPYVSIRERDLTGRTDGRFIVEGKVTLDILLSRSVFEIESLLVSASRLAPLSDLLARVPAAAAVYVAEQAVMDKIAGFAIHRGVLACARKGPQRTLTDVLGGRSILVLNQISNHDNVGAAFRNGAAFGASAVILDAQSCDPLYRKAIRVSAGTSLWLPYFHGLTGADHLSALQASGYEIWAMTPRAGALPLTDRPVPDRLAVVLGAEGEGLPDAMIEAAIPVRIPMMAQFDSVNVATAGAIALAHVFNARRQNRA